MTDSTAHNQYPPRKAGRPLISPLLRAGSGISQADRDKLVYTVGDRMAVLVELNVDHGITVAMNHFTQLFAATFAGQQVTKPVPIARRYLRCLLTQDQVNALGDADRIGPRAIFRIWPDFRVRPHIDRSWQLQPDVRRCIRNIGSDHRRQPIERPGGRSSSIGAHGIERVVIGRIDGVGRPARGADLWRGQRHPYSALWNGWFNGHGRNRNLRSNGQPARLHFHGERGFWFWAMDDYGYG